MTDWTVIGGETDPSLLAEKTWGSGLGDGLLLDRAWQEIVDADLAGFIWL